MKLYYIPQALIKKIAALVESKETSPLPYYVFYHRSLAGHPISERLVGRVINLLVEEQGQEEIIVGLHVVLEKKCITI